MRRKDRSLVQVRAWPQARGQRESALTPRGGFRSRPAIFAAQGCRVGVIVTGMDGITVGPDSQASPVKPEAARLPRGFMAGPAGSAGLRPVCRAISVSGDIAAAIGTSPRPEKSGRFPCRVRQPRLQPCFRPKVVRACSRSGGDPDADRRAEPNLSTARQPSGWRQLRILYPTLTSRQVTPTTIRLATTATVSAAGRLKSETPTTPNRKPSTK